MKHFLPLLLTAVGTMSSAIQLNAEEVYRNNNVRFTLIDEATVRLEYAPDGQFVDNKSFVAVVRQQPNVKHTIKETSKQVTITTSKIKIVYKKTDGPFDEKNLSISYNITNAQSGQLQKGTWHPGLEQKENLKGTYRTLDGYSGDTNIWSHEPIPLEDGLLAKDGWTLIDDSKGLLFSEEADGWDWVTTRPTQDGQDFYFMAYGHNYKDALKSYTKFAGNMPLPPRYTFGYWWSRYWSYSDQDFRDLISNFKNYNIPLDVLVIDMDWHPISPEAGGGWTGWDWNESLFPDYKQFLAYLDEQGVKATMNLHPAEGVRPYEKKYAEFLKRYGRDADAQQHRESNAPKGAVEWLGSDKKMVNALFETYLHPYIDEGVDFWWLDWQQWLNDKEVPELSNTWWCNYIFFTDMERNGNKRPMLYHRWGGLGNHRYQIGFSGDALMTWESLDYLPYFNSTASNVLYGYWSHDIGGHWNQQQGIGVNAEMYTRAMQMGQYLPVLRSHSTKDASLNKEPWAFDNAIQQRIVETIRGRYTLVPYIYTMARKATETGVSLCRPLYYEYPESLQAYDFRNEYHFGDQMIVAPVTKPVDEKGFAALNVWLPEGEWWECSTGACEVSTGEAVERRFDIDEFPVYVKAGSILPYFTETDDQKSEGVARLSSNDNTVVIRVFPGATAGDFELYEDNGEDNKYLTEFATTPLSYTREGNVLTAVIGARSGRYAGMPAKRHYKLALPMQLAPKAVSVGGKALKYSYDAKNFEVVIDLGNVDCATGISVNITLPEGDGTVVAQEVLKGFKGQCQRIQKAVADYKQRNAGMVYTKDFGTLEGMPLRLQYHPEDMVATLQEFQALMARLPQVLAEQMHNADDEARFKSILGL